MINRKISRRLAGSWFFFFDSEGRWTIQTRCRKIAGFFPGEFRHCTKMTNPQCEMRIPFTFDRHRVMVELSLDM